MEESFGDSVNINNEPTALEENKTIWMGGMFDCFSNFAQILGKSDSSNYEDRNWEIPFESIEDLSYLGSGAQGVVFGGKLNGEMVAVKKVREREETNIKHLRKLNHDNIVRLRGICTESPNYCILMDYCQYGSLYDFLRSGVTMPPEKIMKWAKDIALGMVYLHSHKIIHRDLKSPNVLVSDNLTVKVSDFGTCREWDSVSTIMSFTGTVAWMAPEVIRHEPCSEKIDVWSFGVVLWEMLTREIPFKNLETHAVMWGVGTDTLSLPIPSGCPGTLQVLMCQTWQRTPKNRPAFKVLAGHLEMATPDFVAVAPETFSVKQAQWAAEVRESMDKIFAKNEKESSCCTSVPEEAPAAKPRDDFRQVKEIYEQQMNRANELFMEVCTVRLQLEEREKAVAEREKLVKACRCGKQNLKIKREQSSTSSEGKPECMKRYNPPAQMLVNYIDKDEGLTYTVALNGCMCDDGVHNNNREPKPLEIKETVVEENGNIAVDIPAIHKSKRVPGSVIPDVAKV